MGICGDWPNTVNCVNLGYDIIENLLLRPSVLIYPYILNHEDVTHKGRIDSLVLQLSHLPDAGGATQTSGSLEIRKRFEDAIPFLPAVDVVLNLSVLETEICHISISQGADKVDEVGPILNTRERSESETNHLGGIVLSKAYRDPVKPDRRHHEKAREKP